MGGHQAGGASILVRVAVLVLCLPPIQLTHFVLYMRDGLGHDHGVRMWDELTSEQYTVMINAYEEAYLNNVLDDYAARSRREQTNDPTASSDLDDEARRGLVPRFAQVVADMIDRDWIEIREPVTGRWDDAEPMSPEEIRQTLQDETAWLVDTENYSHRMVMLMTTDHWDRLADRFGRTVAEPKASATPRN